MVGSKEIRSSSSGSALVDAASCREDKRLEAASTVWRIVVAAHDIQPVNYLIASGKPVSEREVEVKRKVRNLSQG